MKYTKKITKYVIPYSFCLLVGWVLAEFIAGYKLVPYPKWAVTIAIGAGLALVLYVKKKSRKHTRDNEEYGSAKWGGVKDIKPYVDKNMKNNLILTATESLTMNSRPSAPKYARNKNVMIIGGSGSGKTRFWLKPNLMQCDSTDKPVSFVCTDPKGLVC